MSYAGDVTPTEAWTMLSEEQDAVLVDVRTSAEWRFVGVPNLQSIGKELKVAEWVRADGTPNPDFAAQIQSTLPNQDQTILFICRSGVRSRFAAETMTANGYNKCYNVTCGFEGDRDGEGHRGSMGGWKKEGLPWFQE